MEVQGIPPETMWNRFARVVESECAAMRELSPESARVADRIWDAACKAPVVYFDAALYRVAMDAVRKAEAIDRFLPPAMPFDSVALVDSMGVVLLLDATDYERGERVTTANCNGVESSVSVLRRCFAVVFLCNPESGWTFGLGHVEIVEPDARGNRQMATLNLAVSMCWNHEGNEAAVRTALSAMPPDIAERYRSDYALSIHTALDELYYVDLPRHHVVMEEPVNARRRANSPKVPRAQDRARVRLIDPEAVRRVYPHQPGAGDSGPRTVVPHARRGFTKYLRSERYKDKRWTRIRIRPTWVGPQEWIAGKYQYRVVVRGNDSRSL
jgi:hypothetical protein